jgi:hypothetical protein
MTSNNLNDEDGVKNSHLFDKIKKSLNLRKTVNRQVAKKINDLILDKKTNNNEIKINNTNPEKTIHFYYPTDKKIKYEKMNKLNLLSSSDKIDPSYIISMSQGIMNHQNHNHNHRQKKHSISYSNNFKQTMPTIKTFSRTNNLNFIKNVKIKKHEIKMIMNTPLSYSTRFSTPATKFHNRNESTSYYLNKNNIHYESTGNFIFQNKMIKNKTIDNPHLLLVNDYNCNNSNSNCVSQSTKSFLFQKEIKKVENTFPKFQSRNVKVYDINKNVLINSHSSPKLNFDTGGISKSNLLTRDNYFKMYEKYSNDGKQNISNPGENNFKKMLTPNEGKKKFIRNFTGTKSSFFDLQNTLNRLENLQIKEEVLNNGIK